MYLMLCFSVKVAVTGPSESYHKETVLADVHPTPLNLDNKQVSRFTEEL